MLQNQKLPGVHKINKIAMSFFPNSCIMLASHKRNEIFLQFTMAFAGKISKQIKILHEKSIYLIASVSS